MTEDLNYHGLKKCVLMDYPYQIDWDDDSFRQLFHICHTKLLEEHSRIANPYYSNTEGGIIRLDFLDHYVILCFRFSKLLADSGYVKHADAVYYSLRMRGGIDLYYRANIGAYFIPTHALSAVLDSHSKYGVLFKVYNGVHIGPYSIIGNNPQTWEHPEFGDYVTILAHSKIYGNTKIGNNVIVAANTVIVNEEIPDNCIVSGVSPNLYFMPLKVKNSVLLKEHE